MISLISFLVFHLLTVEVLTSSFKAVTSSSSGEKLCAVAKPSDTLMNVRSAIQCGAICMADILCVSYSFKKDLKECDLYDCTAPQNYSAVLGCSSYKLQGKWFYIILRDGAWRKERHECCVHYYLRVYLFIYLFIYPLLNHARSTLWFDLFYVRISTITALDGQSQNVHTNEQTQVHGAPVFSDGHPSKY